MKLSELITRLIEDAQELNPGEIDVDLPLDLTADPEVRLATQPTWPLAHNVCSITHINGDSEEIEDINRNLENTEDFQPSEIDEMKERLEEIKADEGIVWIAEGASCSDSPHAPLDAWN